MSDESIIYCPNCGEKNAINSSYCEKCGYPLTETSQNYNNLNFKNLKSAEEGILNSVTSQINGWTGGKGAVKVSLFKFFSKVFVRHSRAEAEDIFTVGTDKTTPTLSQVVSDDVRPWLFSRIFFFTLIFGFLLLLFNKINYSLGTFIATDIILCISVPLSALVLFFEINVFRNISFYQVVKIATIGGVLSLILTILLSDIIGKPSQLNLWGAALTGLVEETSKLLIAAYFVRKLKIKTIFNGLLIGAAIGMGFASIENIQYVVDYLLPEVHLNVYVLNSGGLYYSLFRTLTSIATHTEWCAISTAGLVLVKGSKKLSTDTFLDIRFLRFYFLVIIIHMLWDLDILNSSQTYSYVTMACLTIITWITVFIFINAGLREVKLMKNQMQDKSLI